MAVTVTERDKSRSRTWGQAPAREDLYTVRGTADQDEAGAALAAAAPTAVGNLARLTYRVDPISVDTDNAANSTWLGTVTYGNPAGGAFEPLEIGDCVVSCSTLGGTEHVTWPKERLGAYIPSGESTTPVPQGIGDDGKGHVAGVDVPARALELEVTKVFNLAGDPAPPAADTLWVMATTVNNDTFTVTDSLTGRSWTFAAGECMLMGHQEGRARVDDGLEIAYRLSGSPNVSDEEIPNTGITVASKPGHAYAWPYFEETEDETSHTLVSALRAVYVDRTFDLTDFSALGL